MLLPVRRKALALLAFLFSPMTLGQLNLHYHLQGSYPYSWFGLCREDFTALDVLKHVGESLGISYHYVVVYRAFPKIDRMGRTTERCENLRVGTSTSACNATQLNSKPITEFGLHCGESVDVFLRPMKGDHIHYAFVTYIDGKMLGIPYDVAPLTSPYEGKPLPPLVEVTKRFDYHIAQVWPHFGIHSGHARWFGYGLIHIHIGTAWHWFRATEGLGATLEAFLEQVGIWIWERDSLRYPWHSPTGRADAHGNALLDFPTKADAGPLTVGGSLSKDGSQNVGGTPIADYANVIPHRSVYKTPDQGRVLISSNETHVWRLYYWSYVGNIGQEPDKIIEVGLGRIILNENLGVLVLSYERRDNKEILRPPSAVLGYLDNGFKQENDSVSSYYTLGFDGSYYPMPNAPDLPPYPPPMNFCGFDFNPDSSLEPARSQTKQDETVTFYEGGPKEEWKSEAWGRYSSSSHDGFEGSRAHGLP